MKQIIKIPKKTMIPNPNYNKELAEKAKGDKQFYGREKEIELIEYTVVDISGVPETVKKIADYVMSNFEVE